MTSSLTNTAEHGTKPALLRRPAAAAYLGGVSIDYLEERVLPEIEVIREGRLVLIPTAELDRWITQHRRRHFFNGGAKR